MPEDDYRTHEILLENRHLAFIGAGVLVLCVAAFLVGRWTERSRWVNPDSPLPRVAGAAENLPILGASEAPPPLEEQAPPVEAMAADLPAEAAEPAEEARNAPAPEPRAEKGRQTPAGGEDLYIQVLATRHSDAAEALRDRLAGRRYPVAVVSSPDKNGRPMYRVRVGGYDSRQEAEQVAARLQKEERLKTWIP